MRCFDFPFSAEPFFPQMIYLIDMKDCYQAFPRAVIQQENYFTSAADNWLASQERIMREMSDMMSVQYGGA